RRRLRQIQPIRHAVDVLPKIDGDRALFAADVDLGTDVDSFRHPGDWVVARTCRHLARRKRSDDALYRCFAVVEPLVNETLELRPADLGPALEHPPLPY